MHQFRSFIRRLPILNLAYNALRIIYIWVINFVLFLFIIFFLIQNYRIFINKKIYLFWTWSFGHQVLSYDWISRYYYPEKISLIFIPHPRNNIYLPYCFKHSFNTFTFRSKLVTHSHRNGEIAKKLFKHVLLFISIFTKDLTIYHDIPKIYKSFSKNYPIKFQVYNHERNSMVSHINNTGYYDLLNSQKGMPPHLSTKLKEYVEQKIVIRYPRFLEKKFVFLLLRKNRSHEHFDYHRRNGELSNYFKAVKYLCSNNYNTIIAEDNIYTNFKELDNSLNFSYIDCDKDLLNLYLLTQCSLLISQQSGAHILANSVGIPVILCEAYPFYLGTFKSNDVILFKKIIYKEKYLSLNDIIINHSDLIYGKIPDNSEYQIEFNTEEEILNAVQRKKIKKFNFPDNTPIHYTNNFVVET